MEMTPQEKAGGEGRDKPGPAGTIVIVRHGRPHVNRKVRITAEQYLAWWEGYDLAGLAPDQEPPQKLRDLAQKADCIFASSLPRAIETAHAVAPGRELTIDPVFIEAPLPPPPIPGKRSPRRWGVYSRFSWYLGRHAGLESRPEAELRAEAAVATLTARALRGENVMLCAHGWFNRMMRPVLRAQGWRCVHDGGDTYWAYRIYKKVR